MIYSPQITPQILYPRLITQTSFENSKIISYGIILLIEDTNETIILQRLHSVEFLLLLSGQYRPSLICLLVPHMTLEEVNIFKKLIKNKDLYIQVFIEVGYEEKDYEYAYIRFIESIDIIEKCIKKYKYSNELKWTFPKGRINTDDKEDGFSCACREFSEEVEYKLPEPIKISKDYIVVETLKTLGCKVIETRCWVYVIKEKFKIPDKINNKEVNARTWMPLKDALELMGKEFLYNIIISYKN